MRRFYNFEKIVNVNNTQFGRLYEFIPISTIVYPYDTNPTIIIEIYTPKGDFINVDSIPVVEIFDEKIYVDINKTLEKFSLLRGSYKLVIRLINDIYKNLKIKEISPDRTELKIPFPNSEAFLTDIKSLGQLNNLALIRDDVSCNIINYFIENQTLYLKLINPLPDFVNIGYNMDMIYELSDSLVETISILRPIKISKYNKIKGPRFDIDADSMNTDSTVYKCWQDLVGTNQLTSQKIIDKLFNTDSSVILNIDWTRLENYIFYSSAKERIENFYEKIKLIKETELKIQDEQAFTGDYVENSIEEHQKVIDSIIESFDSFERFLYYVNDPKIFTHEAMGPIRPWPKVLVGDELQLKDINHPDVISWYSNILNVCEQYDLRNTKSLWYSIPEHILMDESNSQYILFVQMLGQHFDNIWSYVNALTQIHDKDEHYQRGPASELLEHIAKSFGWNLNNARLTSDLWLYKLGTDDVGDSIPVDNMVEHEQQSYQVWRRIVNNLPHLLKTKGTSRSIKALMNIFGIPNTLISIKEYGGPGLDGDNPILIEDRYHYKLLLDSFLYNDYSEYSFVPYLDRTCSLTGSIVPKLHSSNIISNMEPTTADFSIIPPSFGFPMEDVSGDYTITVPNNGEKIKVEYSITASSGHNIYYEILIDNSVVYTSPTFTTLSGNYEIEGTHASTDPTVDVVFRFFLPWSLAALPDAILDVSLNSQVYIARFLEEPYRYIQSDLSNSGLDIPSECDSINLPIFKNELFQKGFLHWDINEKYIYDYFTEFGYTFNSKQSEYPTLETRLIDTVEYEVMSFSSDILDNNIKMNMATDLNLLPYMNYTLTFHGTSIHSPHVNPIYVSVGNAITSHYVDHGLWTEVSIPFVSDEINKLYFLIGDSGIEIGNIRIELDEFQPARLPDTYEFRFQPQLVNQVDSEQDLFSIRKTQINGGELNHEFINCRIKFSSNFSEVEKLYKICFYHSDFLIGESDELPMYDGNMWTIRLYKKKYKLTNSLGQAELYFDIGSSNDCVHGILSYHSSGIIETDFVSTLTTEQVSFLIGYNTEKEGVMPFKGYIQGYKEYYDVYSFDVFKQHVLNPFAYNTNTVNGAYDTLYKYFPLGLDLQKWAHNGAPGTHPSSQPNRTFVPSALKFWYFSNDENENYKSDTETYYINVPKIGGRTLQSDKIRIEDTTLESLLSSTKKSTANEYDLENPDSNKLAIVFSLADQINRDVFNHIGKIDLDSSIGDPMYEFENSYAKLNNIRRRYFKKYQQRNDINTFIRLLSVYDYTFFDQIKQLVPGRANLIAGILIEPHALEKNKVKIFGGFNVENNLYEPLLNGNIFSTDGEFVSIEGGINTEFDAEGRTDYLSGTIERNLQTTGFYELLSGCIRNIITSTSHMTHTQIYNGCIDVNICGIGGMESVIDKARRNCRYKLVDYLYDKFLSDDYSVYEYLDGIPTGYDGPVQTLNNVQLSLIQNADKRPFNKYIDIIDTLMDNPTDKFNMSLLDISIPAGNYECTFWFELLDGSHPEEDVVVDCNFVGTTQSGNGSFYIEPGSSEVSRLIRPYVFDLVTTEDDVYSLNISIESLGDIYDGSLIRFYGLSIYKKLTPYQKQLVELSNRILGKNKHGIYSASSYQIEEGSSQNFIRFVGSKLSGPDFNIPSLNTIDKGPVVEIREVDGGLLIVDSNNDNNLKIN